MFLSNIFIVFILIAGAIAGGPSPCDKLQSNMVAFYPKFNAWAQSSYELLTNGVNQYPTLGEGLLGQLRCRFISSQIFLTTVLSRWSDLSINSIGEAMTKQSNELPYPLSCIQNEISSINQTLIQQITDGSEFLSSHKQTSNYNPLSSCDEISSQALPYFKSFSNDYGDKMASNINATEAAFNEMNLGDLFIESFSRQCIVNSFGASLAELLNADPIEVAGYINGTSTSVPAPLSCDVDEVNAIVNSIQEEFSFLPIVQNRFWWFVAGAVVGWWLG